MKKRKLLLLPLAGVLLAGCAKQLDTIPIDVTEKTETEAAAATAAASKQTNEKNETEPETDGSTTENVGASETDESTQELTLTPETTKETKTETETEPEPENIYGISGLQVLDWGVTPNVFGDICHVGYMSGDAATDEGSISELELYDTEDGKWVAKYLINDGTNIKTVLATVNAGDAKVYGKVIPLSVSADAENAPAGRVVNVGSNIWFITKGSQATAARYTSSGQKHNVITLPDGGMGVFRKGNNTYYYSDGTSLISITAGSGSAPAAVKLKDSFTVESVLGAYEYGGARVLVGGKDKKGADAAAIIDPDDGSIIYTGRMDYTSAVDDGYLLLKSVYDGNIGEIKYYRSGYAGSSFKAVGELKSQMLAGGDLLLYFERELGNGLSSYYVYIYNSARQLIYDSRFETYSASLLAGEAVKTADGHIILPMRSVHGIMFYEWDPKEIHPDIEVPVVEKAADYK